MHVVNLDTQYTRTAYTIVNRRSIFILYPRANLMHLVSTAAFIISWWHIEGPIDADSAGFEHV